MQNLSVVVQNDTETTGVACLYWTVSTGSWPTEIWLTTGVHWGKSATITWTPTWQFVWGKAQSLNIGVVVTAAQAVNADLNFSNQITLSYDATSGFSLNNLVKGPNNAYFYLICDDSIPPQQAAAGLGMQNAPVMMSMAQLNFQTAWTPPPQLWIAFAEEFTQGEVIDPSTMSGAAQIVFPPNTLSMTATLHADGTWSIAPTPL